MACCRFCVIGAGLNESAASLMPEQGCTNAMQVCSDEEDRTPSHIRVLANQALAGLKLIRDILKAQLVDPAQRCSQISKEFQSRCYSSDFMSGHMCRGHLKYAEAHPVMPGNMSKARMLMCQSGRGDCRHTNLHEHGAGTLMQGRFQIVLGLIVRLLRWSSLA